MAARSASSFEDYPRMPLTLLPSEQERAVVAVTMISLEMWGSDSFQLWLKNKGIPLHATHGVHSPDSHLAGPRRHLRCGIKSSPSPPSAGGRAQLRGLRATFPVGGLLHMFPELLTVSSQTQLNAVSSWIWLFWGIFVENLAFLLTSLYLLFTPVAYPFRQWSYPADWKLAISGNQTMHFRQPCLE